MENFTMLQFFEWYFPADGSLWNHFKAQVPHLKGIGIDTVWLPPAHKVLRARTRMVMKG